LSQDPALFLRTCEFADFLPIAETGDFDSVVRYVEKAMQAHDAGEMTKTLQQHLAMFKEHRRLTSR
jgi:hypothetical protein